MSRTAFTSPEYSTLQARYHSLIGCGIAIHTPSTVWTGTASAPSFPADGTGAGTLTISTVSGSYANVVEGMSVVIEISSFNNSKPQYYFTYARKASIANTLYIDGLGKNTVSFSGATIKVYDQYLPQPRRFRFNSGTWYCNFDTAYVAQNENFGPLALMGPGTVVYQNGSVTSSFDGTRSFTYSSGATITAYLWTFPDGSTSSSATPTWANSTAYPNGAYYSLKVTDSNGDTHTGHRLYFKFDSTHKPKTDFQVTNHHGEWGGGYTATIESIDPLWNFGPDYVTLANQCILFSQTAYYTTVQNIGGNFPGAENIRLCGYLTATDYEHQVDGSKFTYTIATIDELLRNQFAFPLTMDDTAGAATTTWLTMNPITLNNIMHHYVKWRSTISICTDVNIYGTLSSVADDTKKYMDIQPGTMWDQLKSIYSWLIGGQVSVDWQSAIYCEQDVMITHDTSAIVQMLPVFDLPAGIAREGWTFPTTPNYIRKVAKFSAYGVDYATPVGSYAPDDPAAHGAALEEISAGLMGSQTILNSHAGHRRTQLDNPFPPVTIPTRGIFPIDCTPQCSLGTPSPWPPMDATWIIRTVDITYDTDHGMMFFEFGCEHYLDTDLPGVTVVFT